MIGVVVLAHGNLQRAGQLARHMADNGCAVVLHVDAGAPAAGFHAIKEQLSGHTYIRFAPRKACEWGRFSLVEASLGSVRLLLETWPDVSHVAQLSGACLPLRPIGDLQMFLAERPGADFIEAIPVARNPWVIGGLSEERFTLFHPFSWKRQRALFDLSVRVQRLLRIHRRLPGDLKPCIGSQWWCLSRETLEAILSDPDLPRNIAFFRRTWIPDETFFQTLATRHGRDIVTTPLTFVRFDPQGKPYAFYDDHLELLLSVDAFFARKVWSGAEALYETFLGPGLSEVQPAKRKTEDVLKRLARARNLRVEGRRGMLGPGRHPVRKGRGPDYQTARPYTVIDGPEQVLPALLPGLNADQRMRAHGALFDPRRAEFHDLGSHVEGNLPADAAIRDYRPEQFLVNLIWSDRRRSQVFCHDFASDHPVRDFILSDPNAQIIRLEEGWLFRLLRQTYPDDRALTRRMREELAREAWLKTMFRHAQADVMSVSLGDLLEAPSATAHRLAEVMPPYVPLEPLFHGAEAPTGLTELIGRLTLTGAAPVGLEKVGALLARHARTSAVLGRKI